MHLASERTEKEIAADRAMTDLDDALRRLAANVMRTIAGGGKSYNLVGEASQFTIACVAYSDAIGHFPSAFDLDVVLVPKPDPALWERLNEENRREVRAVKDIETGVLRAVAARLVGPRVRASRASSVMYEGVNAIIDLRHKRDAQFAASRKAEAARRAKPTPARKAARSSAKGSKLRGIADPKA